MHIGKLAAMVAYAKSCHAETNVATTASPVLHVDSRIERHLGTKKRQSVAWSVASSVISLTTMVCNTCWSRFLCNRWDSSTWVNARNLVLANLLFAVRLDCLSIYSISV